MIKDIYIRIDNTDIIAKTVNIWDYWQGPDGKPLPANEKKPFTLGHLRIYTTSQFFFSCTPHIVLDKEYILHNYRTANNENEVLIYNFKKHWLAPLMHVMDPTQPLEIIMPAGSSVWFNFSVVNPD